MQQLTIPAITVFVSYCMISPERPCFQSYNDYAAAAQHKAAKARASSGVAHLPLAAYRPAARGPAAKPF